MLQKKLDEEKTRKESEAGDKDEAQDAVTSLSLCAPASSFCSSCVSLRRESLQREESLQARVEQLERQALDHLRMGKDDTGEGLKEGEKEKQKGYEEYVQNRLEETMNEAKRHFNNYVHVRYLSSL